MTLAHQLALAAFLGTLAAFPGCGGDANGKAQRAPGAPAAPAAGAETVTLITMPRSDGHRAFVDAIDGARRTIKMTMFHLTDPQATAALARARARGVSVQLIVDGASLKDAKYRHPFDELVRQGVAARGSSSGFSITHAKAMVVDQQIAFVTAINLTRTSDFTRDFGVILSDRAAIDEIDRVFDADWQNAATGAALTPPLTHPALVWSPVNARERLVALIDSATRTLLATVENLGERAIQQALARAHARGVRTRLIVPMCDENPNPLFDFAPANELASTGVEVRMMPYPPSARQPYMHSKMILVDGARFYVGSVNFSENSVGRARELGIILARADVAAEIAARFEEDWSVAVPPPNPPPSTCPKGD